MEKCILLFYGADILYIGYSGSTLKPKNWQMYNMNFEFFGLIFIPYCFGRHWRLLTLDVENKTIMHLDPICQDDATGDRAIKLFLNFLKECQTINVINLCEITWQRVYYTNDRPIQKDGYNCGSYIMCFMNRLAERKPLKDLTFDPNTHRSIIAIDIILNSENVNSLCLYCV